MTRTGQGVDLVIQEFDAFNASRLFVCYDLRSQFVFHHATVPEGAAPLCADVDRPGSLLTGTGDPLGCRDTHGSNSPDGAEVTFTDIEISSGRKVFNSSCGTCHAGGITKTNHNVGLDPETLALATPARDNINALVDYMRDPTSYDGEYSIADLHPSIRSSELYPVMRDLDDEDLRLMAGYILVAPKVQGTSWGGGKVYF